MVEFRFRRPKFIRKDDFLIDESKLPADQEILFMFVSLSLGQMIERETILEVLTRCKVSHPEIQILNTMKRVKDEFERECEDDPNKGKWTIASVSGRKSTPGGGRDHSLGWMVVEI